MTVEVAIANKEAIAVAADSAVTANSNRGTKVYQTAEKIFQIITPEPVAVFINGSSELSDMPWSVIISEYNRHLSNKSLDDLEEYKDRFFSFLNKNFGRYFPVKVQEDSARRAIDAYLNSIQDELEDEFEKILLNKVKITRRIFTNTLSDILDKHISEWSFERKLILGTEVLKKHKEFLKKEVPLLVKKKFEVKNIKLSNKLVNKFIKLSELFSTRFSKMQPDTVSGIVFVGFGKKDIFPKTIECHTENVYLGYVKHYLGRQEKITHDMDGTIQAFAQGDVVYNLIEGVHPQYQQKIEEDFKFAIAKSSESILDFYEGNTGKLSTMKKSELLNVVKSETNRLSNEVINQFGIFRQSSFIQPILNSVSFLPKKELGTLAEAFVNITSVNRRVNINADESVGGPTDVVILSKDDGFIWLKKKVYYKKDE